MTGKNVAQGYMPFKTKAGEFILPLLGTVNASEHSYTEHGYRPVSICNTHHSGKHDWIQCISEEGKKIIVTLQYYQLYPEAFVLLSEKDKNIIKSLL
jgi:hypothetical protein